MMAPPTAQLIVVGFHRSGTSLLAQLLHRAGLFLGDELLGAMPSNPYGHFEDVEIVRLHDDILRSHGDTWQVAGQRAYFVSERHWTQMRAHVRRRTAAHRLWGFKDPRVCLFLGPWKYLMPDARFLVIYRDPSECIYSLERRHSVDFLGSKGNWSQHRRFWREADHALRMWVTYNRAVLNFVNAHSEECVVVSFDLLSRSFPIVSEVNRRFRMDLLEIPTNAVFDAAVTTSRPGPQWALSSELAENAYRVWSQFEQLAVSESSEVAQ